MVRGDRGDEDEVAVSVSEVAQIQKKMQELASSSGSDETLKTLKSLVEELKEILPADERPGGDAEGENPQRRFGLEMSAESECDVENHGDDTRNVPSTEEPEEIGTQAPQENPTTWINTLQGSRQPQEEADNPVPDMTTAPDSSKDHEAKTPKKEGVSTEVRTMLRYFCRKSDILWFEDIPELQDLVIPQPMAFVASLRSVISHDVCDKLREINGKELKGEEKDINKKGTMSYKTFVKIFNESKELKFSQQQVWQFLVHLGLAIPS